MSAAQIEARANGPRFDVRFVGARGRLVLARPLPFAGGSIESLVIDLGELGFPVDLSAGPLRFRTRRARLESCVALVDAHPLESAADGLRVRLGQGEERAEALVVDAFGAVAARVVTVPDGADLLLALRAVRAATDRPIASWVRALGAALACGARLDTGRGVLRVERPLRWVLTRALVPHGWRVPDDRGAHLAAPTWEGPRVRLEARLPEATGTQTDAGRTDVLADASVLGAALDALAAGDVAAALAALQGKPGDTAGRFARALRGETETVDLEGLAPPVAAALGLRAALRARDADAIARAARSLASVETVADVAVEGLLAAAQQLGARPGARFELLGLAAARRPRDAALAVDGVRAAQALGDAELVERTAREASARHVGAPRGEVLLAAAQALASLGASARSSTLYAECEALLPEDPRVQAGLAVARLSTDLGGALALLERALPSLHPREAATELTRAAEALAAAGRADAGESLLERAVSAAPDHALAAHALGRLRVARGDRARAADALAGLLAAPASAELADALASAIGWLCEAGDAARAHTFLDAFVRVAPTDARRASLTRRVHATRVDLLVASPSRLIGADADTLERVARDATDAARAADALTTALRSERLDASAVTPTARAAWAATERARSSFGELVDAMAARAGELDDQTLLDAAEEAASTATLRARFARRASEVARAAGDSIAAARALGRAGVADRDLASLRAAIELAERAGAHAVAVELVDGALTIVGEGPARQALLVRRAKLTAR